MLRVLFTLFLMFFAMAQSDTEQIKMAISDYVEGIYEVNGSRIERSVDPTLRKYGYWFNPRTNDWTDGSEMNYKQLVKLAETWNKDNRNVDPNSGKKEITILDQLDKTASAKLVAHWGIDYFHLSKENGKWKIVNVIWQSPPKSE